jgi:hypothetical protein
MDAIFTGVTVGVIMAAVNTAIGAIASARKKGRKETQQSADNARRVDTLERESKETKELVKLTLGTCIILGDGMMQHGLNGDFKRAFCEKKQDALKML